MKTTTRFLKLLLPLVAALFFYTVSSAQTLAQLQAEQTHLQGLIATGTAKLSSPNLSAQDLSKLQAAIAGFQGKLQTVNAQIQALNYNQQRLQVEAAVAQRQSVNNSMQQSDVQLQAAVAAQQALPSAVGTQATQPGIPTTINSPRDLNHPIVPLFISSGNAQQDAQMVRQWLMAHPIIK